MITDTHIDPYDFITEAVRNLTLSEIDEEDSSHKLDAWAAEQAGSGRFPPEPKGNLLGVPARGLVAAFASPELRTPRADDLSENQIGALIADGVDPFADSVHEAAGPVVPEHGFRLATLARAAMCITSLEARAALAEPLGILLISETDEITVDRAQILLQAHLLPQLIAADDRLSGLDPDAVSRTEAPVSDARPKRIPSAVLPTVKAGRGCVLIGDIDHLPDDIHGLIGARVTLPPLDARMVIAILRASHSKTGKLAEAAIRHRLPTDADLGHLPDLALASAFSAGTTLGVANRLAGFVARLSGPAGSEIRTRLDDIVGLPPQTRAPLNAVIADMNAWRTGAIDWSDVPATFLVAGPPGTGKTQIARGLAGGLGVPLIEASYAKWQGTGAGHLGTFLKAMAEDFDAAARRAPCVFLLDELDSFPIRQEGDDRGAQYNSKCVNGLLTQMNRLSKMEGVIFIGVTNHADRIDPAVLRSGRLDTKIHVPPPGRTALAAILWHYLRDAQVPDEVINHLSARLLGQTGADIEALVRRARSLARTAKEDLSGNHLDAAADSLAAPEDPDLRHRIAVHEAGHVLVGQAFGMPARRVRITTEGGETLTREPSVMTADAARRRLHVMMAGRAAERVVFGDTSNGAGGTELSDLANATKLVVRMHQQWGLGDTLHRISDTAVSAVERLPHAVIDKVEEELRAAELRAMAILTDCRAELDQLARRLLAEREIDFEEQANEGVEADRGVDRDQGPSVLPDTARAIS